MHFSAGFQLPNRRAEEKLLQSYQLYSSSLPGALFLLPVCGCTPPFLLLVLLHYSALTVVCCRFFQNDHSQVVSVVHPSRSLLQSAIVRFLLSTSPPSLVMKTQVYPTDVPFLWPYRPTP